MLQEFKILTDQAKLALSADLEGAYKQLNINHGGSFSRHGLEEALYLKIEESICVFGEDVEGKITKDSINKLRSELVYRYVLFGESPETYLTILEIINDACRKQKYFYALTEKEKWVKSIGYCKDFDSNNNIFDFNRKNIRQEYPREFDQAMSIKKLRDKGCEFEIQDSKLRIVSGFEAECKNLENKIKEFGGGNFCKRIFTFLNEHFYSEYFERFLITREATTLPHTVKPQIPFGYLLNLAAKHPEFKIHESEEDFTNIIQDSTTICNALGVQPYDRWGFIFQSGETIIEFIKDIALWDSIFTIPQARPKNAIQIAQSLFDFLSDEDFENIFGFTRKQIALITTYLFSKRENNCELITAKQLSRKFYAIRIEKIIAILDILSHRNVNSKYLLPQQYEEIDIIFKPLLKLKGKHYLLVNRTWNSANYFEVFAATIRPSISNMDHKLGGQLEIFLQQKFIEHNIQFHTGEYRVNGLDGECDVLIESDEGIILIEFKKKVLTRKAKSGIDVNILLDLSDSLLAAQLQAGRSEIILKEQGFIILNPNKSNQVRIDLHNRKVERLALTQLEFGGFQDRTIIKSFFKSLLTHSFNTFSKEKNEIKKFEKLEEKRLVWIEQYKKLASMDENFTKQPFFNCWFLSLFQLLEIIEISHDNNSFYNTFIKTKYMTLSSLDWYKEFDYAKTTLKI